MADAGIVDLYANFVRLWWGDLDIFNGQVFTSFPSDSGFAGDGL